jgi:hypothetical protein
MLSPFEDGPYLVNDLAEAYLGRSNANETLRKG